MEWDAQDEHSLFLRFYISIFLLDIQIENSLRGLPERTVCVGPELGSDGHNLKRHT